MAKKTNLKIIEEIVKNFFKLLSVETKISLEEVETETVKINITTPNTGLLIGYHGDTLSSLQLILSLMVYKKIGMWTHLSVNVGNYREYREEQIKNIVQRAVEQVKTTKQPAFLPYLPGNERRLVHLMLKDNPDIVSESEGEGQNRRVVIKPKTEALIPPQP